MLYFICYDVSCARRRRRLARLLLNAGERVQESAFECDVGTLAKLRELVKRARTVMDLEVDSLRIYRVCAGCAGERRVVGVDFKPPPHGPTVIL